MHYTRQMTILTNATLMLPFSKFSPDKIITPTPHLVSVYTLARACIPTDNLKLLHHTSLGSVVPPQFARQCQYCTLKRVRKLRNAAAAFTHTEFHNGQLINMCNTEIRN